MTEPGVDATGDPQVIIAGAGPVGLGLAAELGSRGVRCLLIDPRGEVSYRRPRAKTTSIRTMEHFRRWGIADRVRAAAPLPADWPPYAVFCTTVAGYEITRFENPFGMREAPGCAETSLQVPQPYVEAVLREFVAELPAVEWLVGHRLEDLGQDVDGAWAILGDGRQSRTVRADYLVGCDGGGSRVRECLGIGFDAEVFPMQFFNVVFRSPELLRVATAAHGPAVHYWVNSARASGMLGPMDGDEVWFGTLQGFDPGSSFEQAAEGVKTLVGADVEIEVTATDPWVCRAAAATRFSDGRIFLAGDAAHVNPPFGGHGFNTGIGDAVNLGWKLAAVLQGWGGRDLLETYHLERREAAAQTIRDAVTNMRALVTLDLKPELEHDSAEGELTRAASAEAISEVKHQEFYSRGLVLGYHYAESPIVVSDGEVPPERDPVHYRPSTVPGVRLPHRWLGPGASIYDHLRAGYALVVCGPVDPADLVDAAERAGVPLSVVAVSLADEPGYEQPSLLLVRPDQHIAWRGDRSPSAPADVLAAITGGIGATSLTGRTLT